MNAQATSHIPHSPSRTVRITRLRDEHERFPGILDDSVFQRLYENAFVIHNGDSRDLVAAYALLTIIDQEGRLYTHEYMVDIYAALMPTSVILAGKDIILSPNGWIFPHEYSDARRAFDAQSIKRAESRQSILKTCSSRAKTSLPKASGEAILAVSFPARRRGTHICAILRVFRGLLRSTPPGVQTNS
jgi:hypothetical protein